jgi:diguanylate cyclase (GGDEF)-like protein/PAS domain S-box-containing protein
MAIKIENDFYKLLLDNLFDGVYFVNRDQKITYWNKSAERITGFSASEVIGRPCSDNLLIHVDGEGNSLCKGLCPVAATMCDAKERSAQIFLRHKDGHRIPVDVRVAPVLNQRGEVEGSVEIFNDNIKQEPTQNRLAELEQMAFLDELTRLPNRRYAEITLKARFDELERYGWKFGVLFVDIDHFKDINDKYGHDLGDSVLAMVGKTLQNSVRSFDIVSRWGGEEYLVIITHIDEQELLATAQRCRVLVQQSGIAEISSLQITVSLGATLARPGDTLTTLFKRVDKLMYQSKEAGRNRVTVG